jgi:hypothetical protein
VASGPAEPLGGIETHRARDVVVIVFAGRPSVDDQTVAEEVLDLDHRWKIPASDSIAPNEPMAGPLFDDSEIKVIVLHACLKT